MAPLEGEQRAVALVEVGEVGGVAAVRRVRRVEREVDPGGGGARVHVTSNTSYDVSLMASARSIVDSRSIVASLSNFARPATQPRRSAGGSASIRHSKIVSLTKDAGTSSEINVPRTRAEPPTAARRAVASRRCRGPDASAAFGIVAVTSGPRDDVRRVVRRERERAAVVGEGEREVAEAAEGIACTSPCPTRCAARDDGVELRAQSCSSRAARPGRREAGTRRAAPRRCRTAPAPIGRRPERAQGLAGDRRRRSLGRCAAAARRAAARGRAPRGRRTSRRRRARGAAAARRRGR